MTETFEDKCKQAYEEHLEYVEGEIAFASVGYADDPRALLGMAYSSDKSNHGTSAREIWAELDSPAITDTDIGHASL